MKRILIILHNLVVLSCLVPYTLAVINVTITGTTTRHVCKGEDIDFKWTYDDTDPDKDFIKTIQWSKDPSGYLIMQYETDTTDLSITSSPNDYTTRVERTSEAGSNDIGMRLIKAGGSPDVDDEGKYYVSLIVDKPGGDANDYFVPYRDPQGVTVYVCVGVDDTFPLPSLSLTYDETTQNITCSGPSSLGNTTFAIFDPSMDSLVDSTTDTTISTIITADPPGGTYRCKTYCTEQGHEDTPQGTCLPSDATLVIPSWSIWGAWDSNCNVPGSSRTHTRTCTDPPPADPPDNGPRNCPGVSTETEICPTPPPTPPPGPCLSSPCANGGTCVDVGNSFTCNCGLWTGTTCTELIIGTCIIQCTEEIGNIPNESFNVTVEMLANSSFPWLAFNYEDKYNFDFVYFMGNDGQSVGAGSVIYGEIESSDVDGDYSSYEIATDWFGVELHVSETTVLLKLNHGMIELTIEAKHNFKPSLGLLQGPPYDKNCTLDCVFSFRNLSVFAAFGLSIGSSTSPTEDFCSSPIRGGCLAVILVFVIIYLINIYVLILICHTFAKGVDNGIQVWLRIILVIIVLILPLFGAVIVAFYVNKKHCGKKKEDHNRKYYVFKCKCRYEVTFSNYDKDNGTWINGKERPISPKNNKVSPDSDKDKQVPPTSGKFNGTPKRNKRILSPLPKTAYDNVAEVNDRQQKKKKKKSKRSKREAKDEETQ